MTECSSPLSASLHTRRILPTIWILCSLLALNIPASLTAGAADKEPPGQASKVTVQSRISKLTLSQPQALQAVADTSPSSLPAMATPAAEEEIVPDSPILKDVKVPTTVKAGAKETGKSRPVGAIAIFPVVRNQNRKAFSDLPIIFSDEFSNILAKRLKTTKIHNPVYTIEEFKVRGLESVYNKVMDFYAKAHRPEPKALRYLLQELSDGDGKKIERVAFVEVDLDVNHTTQPVRIIDRIKALTSDDMPRETTYRIMSRIQMFDTAREDTPMVWASTMNRALSGDTFYDVTPSVFQDSDSIQTFARTSRWMVREILLLMPRRAYIQQQPKSVDTQVQGEVLP